MIESRPDWCVSRQRAWGVPIAVFVDKKTGEPLRDPAVDRARRRRGRARRAPTPGSRAEPAHSSATPTTRPSGSRSPTSSRSGSIRGSTHAFVLEQRPELKWPASLYLEGSDQHRGWFHSSLLESCGTRGRAPYEAVLTHGFVLDEEGRKMSKSLGNVIAPQEVMQQNGADILRLWVVGSDYAEDLRIGPEILKHHGRRLSPAAQHAALPAGRLDGYSARPRRSRPRRCRSSSAGCCTASPSSTASSGSAVEDFDFHAHVHGAAQFLRGRPLGLLFRHPQGPLYCDAPDDPRRRAARTVLDRCFVPACRAGWRRSSASPPRRPGSPGHGDAAGAQRASRLFPEVPAAWRDEALGGAMGGSARPAPRRHRRAGARARREAHRVEPAGRGRAVRARRTAADCCAASISPRSASPRPATVRGRRAARGRLHPARRAGCRRRCRRRRRATRCERCWRCCRRSATVPGHADLCRRCAGGRSQRHAAPIRGRRMMPA